MVNIINISGIKGDPCSDRLATSGVHWVGRKNIRVNAVDL
jgi:hypothetical protein